MISWAEVLRAELAAAEADCERIRVRLAYHLQSNEDRSAANETERARERDADDWARASMPEGS